MRTNVMMKLVLATVSVGLTAASAQAVVTNSTWEKPNTDNSGTGWGQTSHWSAGIPTLAGDTAQFLDSTGTITTDVVITSGLRNVGTLVFDGNREWSITTRITAAELALKATGIAVPSVTVYAGSSASINGRLTGINGFNLSGGGQLRLTPLTTPFVPNVSGLISVSDAGTTLRLNGCTLDTASAHANITVNSGAKFAGSGTIHGTLTLDGTVSPDAGTLGGTGRGSLTTGAETWAATGAYAVKLTGLTLNDADYLKMSSVDVSDGFKVQADGSALAGIFDSSASYKWLIAESGSGDFNVANLDLQASGLSVPQGFAFSLSQTGTNLYLSYSAVPEATTMLLGAAAIMPILLQRRRQRGTDALA